MQFRRNLVFPLCLKQVIIPKNKHFEIETMENLKDITMKVQDPLCGGMQSIRIMKCGHWSRAGRGGGTDLNDSDVLNSATLGTLYRLHTLIKLKYCRQNNVGIVLHTFKTLEHLKMKKKRMNIFLTNTPNFIYFTLLCRISYPQLCIGSLCSLALVQYLPMAGGRGGGGERAGSVQAGDLHLQAY